MTRGDGVETVDGVVAAALAVPGVAGLHAGVLGTAATYLPGRSVAGVALRQDGTEIHLVVRAGADLRAVAGAVHAAVLGAGAPAPVRVHVGAEEAGPPGDPTGGTPEEHD